MGEEHHSAISSTNNLSEAETHFLAFVHRWQARLDSGCNIVDAFLQSSPEEVIAAITSSSSTLADQEAVMVSLGSAAVASGSPEEKREYSEWMTGVLESMDIVDQTCLLPQSMNAEADSVKRMVRMVLRTGTGGTDSCASTVASTPTEAAIESLPFVPVD